MRKPKLFKRKDKIVVGLTGSFGSGKSTVASFFKAMGAAVIDADRISHEITLPGNLAYRRIIAEFGAGILNADTTINRPALACLVFGRKPLACRLNAIIHPVVIRMIAARIKKIRKGVIIVDAPLLFEAGMEKSTDCVVVVKASQVNQVRRIQKKSSLTTSAILKRIQSQIPLREKVRRADFVIDNNGTTKKTKKQVEEIWKSIICRSSGGG